MTSVVSAEPRWTQFAASTWDEAESMGSAVYFPHVIKAVDAGDDRLDFHMDIMEFAGLTLGRTRYGAAISMDCGYLDNYHLIIPLAGTVRSTSGGDTVHATPDSGAIYNHSRVATVHRSPGSDHLALKLDRALVERELSLMLGRSIDEPVVFEMGIDLHSAASHRWLGGFSVLHKALAQPEILADQGLLALELRNLVILGLLVGQRHNYSEALEGSSARSSSSIVRRAAQLLEDEPARAWTVGSLAFESGASVRALQDNFHRVLGVTPTQFLSELRLERARRDLLAGAPHELTVSSVAHRWGFAHLGRFSATYSAKFGESPSHTLRSGE
jgi:AraC-like DNA-binding protein